MALKNLGRSEESIIPFEEAIKIKPDKYEAYMGKSIAYQLQSKKEETQETLSGIPPEVLETFIFE